MEANKITDKPVTTSIGKNDMFFANIDGTVKQVTKENALREINIAVEELKNDMGGLSFSITEKGILRITY